MRRQLKPLLRGGVNPPLLSFSAPTSGIVNAAIPGFALIPMLQHAGRPALCLVKAGDPVEEGMLIGRADGPKSANVHSSIPGTVAEIRDCAAPDRISSTAVLIELGGEFGTTGRRRAPADWERLSRADLLSRIQAAGVVGLGGGLIPTHLKLAQPPGRKVALFIVNGMACEPSMTGDASLLREKSREIAIGARICRKILDAGRTVLAVGDTLESEIAAAFRGAFEQDGAACEIASFPERYPQGHEQLLQAALTSWSVPPSDNGRGEGTPPAWS